MTVTPGLRRQKPYDPVIGQRPDGIDEAIDEIAVLIPPPHDHDIDDVVEVLVDHLSFDDVLDGEPQALIDIIVVAKFLNGVSGLKPEATGSHASLVVRSGGHVTPRRRGLREVASPASYSCQ